MCLIEAMYIHACVLWTKHRSMFIFGCIHICIHKLAHTHVLYAHMHYVYVCLYISTLIAQHTTIYTYSHSMHMHIFTYISTLKSTRTAPWMVSMTQLPAKSTKTLSYILPHTVTCSRHIWRMAFIHTHTRAYS
jgi:hypothetical protein